MGEADFHVMSSPGRYSYGEELRPLAKQYIRNLGLLPRVIMSEHLRNIPSTHSGLRMISVPADILTAASSETLTERSAQLSCSWTPDPQKLCEIKKFITLSC